ncbi:MULTISPECIES: hypothetical protein [Streptomyces]|uniref:ANTAR domain-containing protein n=2 Tax=Streptomyces TaxID=1883 RepID=A0ABV9IVS2_9ACTN
MLFGDVAPDAASSLAKVRISLRALVTETLRLAEEAACTPHQAARRIAEARHEELLRRPGTG